MKSFAVIVLTACLALTGCATNFATSATPVTIEGDLHWLQKVEDIDIQKESSNTFKFESTHIFRVGDIEFGYPSYDNRFDNPTFIIDPGQQMIQVWYLADRGFNQGLLWQTDLVNLNANLKPNGKYQVRGDYGEKFVRFKLADLDTQEVVVVSSEAPIIRRGLLQSDIIIVPIIFPAR